VAISDSFTAVKKESPTQCDPSDRFNFLLIIAHLERVTVACRFSCILTICLFQILNVTLKAVCSWYWAAENGPWSPPFTTQKQKRPWGYLLVGDMKSLL